MFKKLLPVVMFVFVAACANTQGGSQSGMRMKMSCCEKCECCKDGMCKMCMGKMKEGGMSSIKDGVECEICAKAENEAMQKKREGMKH